MNLQVGVKVIIQNSRGQLLLLRRSPQYSFSDDTHEAWDIPGGRIEPQEALEAALLREVREEIGVTLHDKPTLLRAQDIFVADKNLHVVRLTYIHRQDIKDVKLSAEHDQYKWISIGETKVMNIEPFLKAVIESLG